MRRQSTDGNRLKIAFQQFGFADFDGPGILANVTHVIETARQFGKLAAFDGFEITNADFGGCRDLAQGYSFLMAQGGQFRRCAHGSFHFLFGLHFNGQLRERQGAG